MGREHARKQSNRFREAGVTLPMLSLRKEAKRQFKEATRGCALR